MHRQRVGGTALPNKNDSANGPYALRVRPVLLRRATYCRASLSVKLLKVIYDKNVTVSQCAPFTPPSIVNNNLIYSLIRGVAFLL